MIIAAALLAAASPVAAGQCLMIGQGAEAAGALLRRRLDERGETCPRVLLAPIDAVQQSLPPRLRKSWASAAPRMIRDEGFAVRSLDGGLLIITANSTRGLVYGAGWYLRTGARPTALDSAPARPERLTQIGYRAKNNSYDAWTAGMFERRIEDFALWGASGIQVIAPVSDDAPTSPLFPAPPLETLAAIGRVAHRLGLDFALDYPELGDYSKPGEAAAETARFTALVDALPRIDALYVPGGDPGHTAPAQLFPLVAAQARALRARNPTAKIWLSTQGFDAAGLESFYAELGKEPEWLTGLFIGPQTRDPVPVHRQRVHARYPLLLYPDIGHTMHAQFPVPEWHPAFALTQGREPINPRPTQSAAIFRHLAGPTSGFVTYSEGVNDDFNQLLWFRMGWDPAVDPRSLAAEYARMYIGDPGAADAIFALERNWSGDPAKNPGIDATFRQVDALRPATFADWRIDSLRYRAVYDAIVRHRLIAARKREAAALTALRRGNPEAAKSALAMPDGGQMPSLRNRLFTLADRLFAAVRLQLSVPRFGASNVERGANLDRVDVDLNDRVWIERHLADGKALDHERRSEGALYDDLGDPAKEPRLVRGAGFAADPQMYATAIDGIADRTPNDGWRMSEISYAESLYDAPLRLRYARLNPRRRYRLVATYAGEDYTLPMRLVADGRFEIHGPLTRTSNPMRVEFPIPAAATADGILDLAWTRPPGMGGGGRGNQVAETWLIPETVHGAMQ
ncbi:MAG TPA: hypothetical protein VEB39_02485 [Sphingomicrobium sp.]|nr:hypothetical protein [Sphingomicrobium sp.]